MLNLVIFGFFDTWYITLRYYREPVYGIRKLGSRRYAFDVWRFSLIVEQY